MQVFGRELTTEEIIRFVRDFAAQTRGHKDCRDCLYIDMALALADEVEKLNRRAAPENKPLTPEQLRQMDGEPVWIVPLDGTGCGEWTIIAIGAQTETLKALSPDTAYEECNYGKTWLAYARRPEDAQKGSKTHA